MANRIKRFKKNIRKDIDKRLSKTAQSVREDINSRADKKYRQLIKKIAIAGSATILVIVALNVIIGSYIERQVNKQTLDFFEKQKVVFDAYVAELELCLDSISDDYQNILYEKISDEIKSDSFNFYTTGIINDRFDDIAPGIINRRMRETISRFESESKQILDSLSGKLKQIYTVVDGNNLE